MITINLVPPEKKRQISLVQHYLLAKDLIIYLMLTISIIAIIILGAKLIIQNYFTEVINQSTLTTLYVKVFDTDVKKFNQDLAAVGSIRKNFIPWSEFLIELNNLTPPGIAIESLNINSSHLLLTGLAKSRADLLAYKNSLDQSPLLSNIEVPLDNLLKKDNIRYSIRAEINLEKLKE